MREKIPHPNLNTIVKKLGPVPSRDMQTAPLICTHILMKVAHSVESKEEINFRFLQFSFFEI